MVVVENLTHLYNAGTAFAKTALDQINLQIPRGAFVGLIGRTGSGKSTLIQHFNALLRPTSGRVLIDGEDIFAAEKRRLKKIREKVGLVFQYPEHQLFEISVYKDVAFGPTNMGLTADEIDSRVREALDWVGLSPSDYEKSPFELSGGQKRRVAIAGVLAMRPQVLVLDEPTAGLDPHGREEILARLSALHAATQNTIIFVSHSMEEVARLADYIYVMAQGQIYREGVPAAVFADPEPLRAVGLDAPPVSVLTRALREIGVPIPGDIFTVDRAAAAIALHYEACRA